MIILPMVKKIISLLILVTVVVANLALPSTASAQEWWKPNYKDFLEKIDNDSIPSNEIYGERYTHAQVWWVVYSLMSFAIEHEVSDCVINNPDNLDKFINCATAEVSNPNFAGANNLGFLEFAKLSDSMIRIRPASGVTYVASIINKVGIAPAYAQASTDGFGFRALSPVFSLWRASRNASYGLITLAVIVLAFMVMFRTKISPQASVTIQSAIPRIVIGLILITFSYAIAGFIIDFSYVILGIIATIVHSAGIINQSSAPSAVDTFNMVNDIGGGVFNFGMSVVFMVMRSFGSLGGAWLTLGSYGTIPVASTILVLIIALILIVVAVVRIFWIFLRTYVMVIMHVVALPFAALAYVASPSGNMFLQLIKSLIGQVSVFVSIALTVMLAHILLWGMTGAGQDLVSVGNVYHVEELGGTGIVSLPGFTSGADASTVGLFVGIVVLLMGPSIANNIKSFIISGRPAREGFSMIGAGTAAAAGGMAGVGARVGAQDFVSQVDRRLALAGGATTTRLRGEQAIATGLRSVFRLK